MRLVDSKYMKLHPEDQCNFLNFKKFESIPTLSDYVLSPIGASIECLDDYDNIVFMLYEEPNNFWHPEMERIIRAHYPKIKKLLCGCPYSTKFFNELYGDDKREYTFFPFNIENIPTDFTKKYDVYFTGHVFHDFIGGFVNVIEKFNNAIVSFNYGNYRGATYRDKLQINANSKISVVMNCLYETSGIPMDEQFPKHEAFKNLKKSRFIPQLKSRTTEAAACKSIILSHFEDFRVVEMQFKENHDFIYWYNNKDLEEKIHEILNNYDKYTYLAENAYQTLINNWTTYHFFEKYLRNL